MRYLGNKQKIADLIVELIGIEEGQIILDPFSGTTSMAKAFKKSGAVVKTSDIMYLSYVLQKAYIENNKEPTFDKLTNDNQPYLNVLSQLNSLNIKKGFIFENYTPVGANGHRMFFTGENGAKIDTIRTKIEHWHSLGLISEMEYFILLASLIESVSLFANTTGVYEAYLKKWDSRALKPFEIKPIDLLYSNQNHQAHHLEALELIELFPCADVTYLDPPYNNRQYSYNYHLLETIARYDNPEIKGVAGKRVDAIKSDFSSKVNAKSALVELISKINSGRIAMSYNTDGILSIDDIQEVFKKNWLVDIKTIEHQAYKSNSGATKTKACELLFLCEKKKAATF